MKKKLLSLALALAMCLGLTVPALAEDWENAKGVKNFEEFLAAVLDEKVEEIKIVGEVTIPEPVEYPLTVETPVLVGKEGKLTMAPGSTMYVHVPMGRFSFEDQENTWDHIAEMCETWAVENGVTSGTGDGTTFSPDNTCTRGQIVTFLYRAARS